jgi:hypothetical protein
MALRVMGLAAHYNHAVALASWRTAINGCESGTKQVAWGCERFNCKLLLSIAAVRQGRASTTRLTADDCAYYVHCCLQGSCKWTGWAGSTELEQQQQQWRDSSLGLQGTR